LSSDSTNTTEQLGDTRVVAAARGPLSVRDQLTGARLLVVGGTGFLGKVWLCLLLHRFPEVEHIYLMVREKDGRSSEERFWAEIAPNPAFDPLREQHPGIEYEAFMRRKITPISGDLSREMAGIPAAVRDSLRGTLTALINSAGVVDFTPPLDDALNVNAFGMQKLVALAHDLGAPPVMHTSTCFVAGERSGQVEEVDPRDFPFPRAHELDRSHWNPQGEIDECVDVVETVRHRVGDAFRQSEFLARAKENLIAKGEPARGSALDDEFAKVRRRYESQQLVAAGMERAQFWGWPNTYTYTKSIGEQILCESGLRFTIVRPAVIESSISFPQPGWNEGITTSAPLTYLCMMGMVNLPVGPDSVLDIVPCDMVAAGMLLALAELLEGQAPTVYQLGTSDTNPLPCRRLYELTSLYKRRHYRAGTGSPLIDYVQRSFGTTPISLKQFERWGSRPLADATGALSGLLKKAVRATPVLGPLFRPARKALDQVSKSQARVAWVIEQYIPFIAVHTYRFSCRNMRAAHARLSDEEQASLDWSPEKIDWREYLLDIHLPGLEKLVWPQIEAKLKRPKKALRRHDDLLALIEEAADRHGHATALALTHPDGLQRVSFLELRDRVAALAARLRASGLEPGDRVLLAGSNHPDWVVAWFGVLRAGCVVVPVEPGLPEEMAVNISTFASVKAALLDSGAVEAFGHVLLVPIYDLHTAAAAGPDGDLPVHRPDPSDTASILFTSGTTGVPKGVMLSHANFTSLLASLSRVFQLGPRDRVLSVLPLHHTFEFACGLLLPLASGAQVLYLDEISGESLLAGLRDGRITGMVGVPALWELLERRIRSQVKERGALFETAFDLGLEFNRILGRTLGVDVGKTLFGQVHDRLGGNIRFLISGGAALPKDTHSFFAGLGLHLAEGYGLTEAAPVLTVAQGRPGARPGNVGRPIPGVELSIHAADDQGVGEVLARGPNVMSGYFGNDEATAAVLDDDGWLHTGDLGRLDAEGRLILVGRAKDVVVTASGENIHLDDVEERVGTISGVREYSLVGLPLDRGGERLGMLAVPDVDDQASNGERRAAFSAARASIRAALLPLPVGFRPTVIHLVDADLPRTATRKVKRTDVKRILKRIEDAASATAQNGEPGGDVAEPVRRAVALVAGVGLDSVSAGTRPAEDLKFDSLMYVELSAALESLPGGGPAVTALAECATVGDMSSLAGQPPAPVPVSPKTPPERVTVPGPLVGPLKQVLTEAQRRIYGSLLDVTVTGRAHIPQNRPTIVVSNHTSHLDMGLVKYALGEYGREIVGLAASDYFFEGNKWKVAYFTQLTQLAPVSRDKGFRHSLRQAVAVVERGHVVLMFPEGTRRVDGTLGEFKPLVGKLALETGVDVLPLHLGGTYDILPKGGVVPKGRRVRVRIGLPIASSDLRRLTKGLKRSDASRAASRLIRQAVETLGRGSALDVAAMTELPPAVGETPVDPVVELFTGLPSRFRKDHADPPISWYFKLGEADGRKWTVIVADGEARVVRGRPPMGRADCVVKTHPEMMVRIIGDAYAPGVPEFMNGTIKTNDIPMLLRFVQAFRLGPDGAEAPAESQAEPGAP
jgi:long-chain acyl-CoA synthetase